MDKELKELKRTICRCCPYGPDTTKSCNNRYCDMKKVMDAYKDVKKDLAGRQKKIKSLTIDFASMKASRDYYKENYEVECSKNRNLYARHVAAIRENMGLKIKLAVEEVFQEDKQNED